MELLNSAVVAALVSGVMVLIGILANARWQQKQLRQQARQHEELLDLELQKFGEQQASSVGGAVVAAELPRLLKKCSRVENLAHSRELGIESEGLTTTS